MKNKYKKPKLIDISLMLILFLFVFNGFFTKYISGVFSYIEDIAMIVMILIFMIQIIRKRGKIYLEKYEKVILVSYVLIYILGIIGNIVSEFQESKFAILVDILSWTKFFIAYIGLVNIIKKDTADKYYLYLVSFAKLIIVIGLVLELLNLTTNIELADKLYARFGIGAFSLFSHPAFTSSIFAGLTSILLVEPKKNKVWIFFGLILTAATLRAKSIAFVCLIIYSLIFLRNNKNVLLKVLILGMLVVIVGWSQIQSYFLDPTASRARVLNTSIEIANDYFPTGSGFATFGTMISGQYYSKAYDEYGLNDRWGFREDAYSFVADGGWATIIGEFGYIGTILFIVILICLILSIKERTYETKVQVLPYISLIGYLLISSTNEAAFNSNYALLYAIILAVIVKKQQSDSKEKNQKKDCENQVDI